MTDINFLSPNTNDCILTTHIEVLSRANANTGVVSGNKISAANPATMHVLIDAGRIRVAGRPVDVLADEVVIAASDATQYRIDILYRDAAGDVQIHKGSNNEITDPVGNDIWQQYTTPAPSTGIPEGAILGAIWVPALSTTITTNEIWMFGGQVPDVVTTIGAVGSDYVQATEKAIRTAIDTGDNAKINTSDIVTSVADPGLDTKVPSEQAVRELANAISLTGVTNGDSHDHSGGDGAQVDHGGLGGLGDDDHSQYHNNTRGDARYAALAHASRHASGGADAIKLDDLAAPDTNNTDLNASTTAHGLMQAYPNTAQTLKGDGTWITRVFDVAFGVGDGNAVIQDSRKELRIPINCKIVAARTCELSNTTGTYTVTLYKRTLANANWTSLDTYAVANGTYYEETGLNIAVSAGEWVSIRTSNATGAKQITVSLSFEAT